LNRRVVVTGMGVISALGPDLASFWETLSTGGHGIRPLQGERVEGLAAPNAAQIRDYLPGDHFSGRDAANLDPFAQYLVVAGREAVAATGLTRERLRGAAVVAGCGSPGQVTLDEQFHRLYGMGRRVVPNTVPKVMPNAGVSALALEFGIGGPVYAVATACASATHAIGQASWLIRHGVVDIALAGGSEAPLAPGNLRAWDAIRALDPERCRPFCRTRRGTTLGEGGGILVLESLESARERGAEVLAEVAGLGMSSDAHDLTRPLAQGAAQAITASLRDARMRPDEVDYVNAHGTGTPANDAMETKALRLVFGAHADRLVVSSTKSAHGHALGASGALEAIATVMAMRESVVPPTLGVVEADPECDLDFATEGPRRATIRGAVSNSFGFGGLNAVLAFRQLPGDG
jgi:nodulation protein E